MVIFFLLIRKDNKMKFGERVTYRITITQNIISLNVLKNIAYFIRFGSINKTANDVYQYNIDSLENINKFNKIFKESKLQGAKSLDYKDFLKGIEIINNKE